MNSNERRRGGHAAAAVWYSRAAVEAHEHATRARHAADWLDLTLRREMPMLTAEVLHARAVAEHAHYSAQAERYFAASRAMRMAEEIRATRCVTPGDPSSRVGIRDSYCGCSTQVTAMGRRQTLRPGRSFTA